MFTRSKASQRATLDKNRKELLEDVMKELQVKTPLKKSAMEIRAEKRKELLKEVMLELRKLKDGYELTEDQASVVKSTMAKTLLKAIPVPKNQTSGWKAQKPYLSIYTFVKNVLMLSKPHW